MKLLVVALALAFAHPVLAKPTQAELRTDRAEMAAKVFPLVLASFEAGKATPEAVYQWSVRWLDADLDRAKGKSTPLADHAARMFALEAEAKKQVAAGILQALKGEASTYYRIEAELWVARGKPH
ncbi:MAG: hypothetical protein NT062_08660 [Proteobacteria bacterium]|nr:hypothetical protein [Pseudomonadota bacterium]